MASLGDYVEIKTGKLDANAATTDGPYPFFTCSRKTLQIDQFAFDADAILVAGNGDLNVKHYRGKFNAYQRTYVITVKLNDALDTRFLYHWMSKYVDRLRELSIGGVIKYIKLGMLTDAELPLPPLDEQKRIAAILDKADGLRRKREKAIALTDDLLRSVFLDMFGDPKTYSERFPLRDLVDVSPKITDGEHGTVMRVDRGELYLMARNITRDSRVDLTQVSYITEADHKRIYRRCNPETNDLLLVCVGATIGKVALVPKMPEFSLARSVALIKNDKSKCNPVFMLHLFNSTHIQHQLLARRNTSAQAGLYLGQIKKIKVPYPDIQLQNEFAAIAEKVAATQLDFAATRAISDGLFFSLAKGAFQGDLTSKNKAAA